MDCSQPPAPLEGLQPLQREGSVLLNSSKMGRIEVQVLEGDDDDMILKEEEEKIPVRNCPLAMSNCSKVHPAGQEGQEVIDQEMIVVLDEEEIPHSATEVVSMDCDPVVQDLNVTPTIFHSDMTEMSGILATRALAEAGSSNCGPLKAGFLTPITSNHLISSNLSSSSKKSNLRKFSRYEESPNGTPSDPNPTPRKRIRIVENLEAHNQNNHVMLEGDLFEAEPLDVDTKIYRTSTFDEEILWVSPSTVELDMSIVNSDTVRTSRVPVPKKFSVEIDMRFIDNETLEKIIECKHSINNAGAFEYEKLCSEIGPFRDTHRFTSSTKAIFKYEGNAMKLANLDAALEFDLTCPKTFFQHQTPEDASVFYFGDIWATSKGFREYILWKTQEYLETKGIVCKGFTLNAFDRSRVKTNYNEKTGVLFNSVRHNHALEDEDLPAVPVELVESFIGEGTIEFEDGSDLLDTAVTDGFVQRMLDGTDGKGVHLLVADNAECFNVHETIREIRFQRSLYCQCIVALLAVREGGNFVVKMFDSITLFTVGLVFLMHRCFKSISIHKPKTSPPHSSERFLICRDKLDKDSTEEIEQFLLESHAMVVRNEEIRRILRKKIRRKLEIQTMEVKELVPLRVIISHAEFFEFIRLNNIRLSKDLVLTITKVLSTVAVQKELLVQHIISMKQSGEELKGRLGIQPNSVFTRKFEDPEQMLSYLLNQSGCDNVFWRSGERSLTQSTLKEISENPGDWQVFVIQDGGEKLLNNGRGLFVGLGTKKIWFFDGMKWNPVNIEGLQLTKGTVFYGEIVEQISQVKGLQRIQSSCQILDALFISGRYIGNLPFNQRKLLCKSYATAIRKTTASNRDVLRVHDSSGVDDLSGLFNSFGVLEVVGYSKTLRVHKSQFNELRASITVGGLLFWKIGGIQNDFVNSMSGRIVCKMNGNRKSPTDVDDYLVLNDLMALKI